MRHAALRLENQPCFPLYAASREVIKRYRPYLDALELTYTQYIVLLVLWEHGTISVRDLGRRLYLDSGTLTPVLKTMEKVGLITRRRSTVDERVLMITPTSSALTLQNKAQEIPAIIRNSLSLDEGELAALMLLLNKLLVSSG
ncbi:MAG: MarR family transcriptional regulator [Clostridiales bacterium]|nr:MarR family transcriptional regulator [Clostridiales bacterium]